MGPLCALRRDTEKQLQTGEEKVSSLCCSIELMLEADFSLFLPFTGAVSRKRAPDFTLRWNKDIK